MLDEARRTAVDMRAGVTHIAVPMGAHAAKMSLLANIVSPEAAKRIYATQNVEVGAMAAPRGRNTFQQAGADVPALPPRGFAVYPARS